jgi:hypothetical protein
VDLTCLGSAILASPHHGSQQRFDSCFTLALLDHLGSSNQDCASRAAKRPRNLFGF